MSKKLVLTCIVCSLWLHAATPDGSQLSKCRFVSGKSCETKLADTGQNTHDQVYIHSLNNANLHGRLIFRSRTLMSTPDVDTGSKAKKPSSMFITNVHQQWRQQPLEKQRQVSSATYQRSRHYNQYNAFDNPGSGVKPQQPHDSAANSNPHLMSHGHNQRAELWHVSSQGEKSHGKFLTESTIIHPFIATRQALDYLTSYDSKPPPRRWPLRLILPEGGHKMLRVTGVSTPGHMHSSGAQMGKNRHARSTDHTLRQVNEDRTRGEAQHETHGIKAKGKLTYENITIGKFEDDVDKYIDGVVSDKSHGQQMINATNKNTRNVYSTVGSIPTAAKTARRGNRKRKNRVHQQLQKRNKKLRKRNKQRFQLMSEANFTTIATNDIGQLSSADSVHVLLSSVVFQRPEYEQIAENIGNEPSKSTEMNASQLLKNGGVSALKLRAEASGNTQVSGGNIFNETSEQRVPAERRGHGELTYDGITLQPQLKQRQLRANKNKSKNKRKKVKGKSNNSNVSIQTDNGADNHMFVSLKPDFSPTTFFPPVNSKTVMAGTGVKALLENCSQESANVSSDNTRQIVSDRNLVAHLPAHTNSGRHNTQVMTSSETWPPSQAVWGTFYSTTEDVSRSTRKHSAVQEMSQSRPMFVKNKAANVDEYITIASAEKVVSKLRNFSLNSFSLTTSMEPPSVNTPERSSAEFWKARLRKNHREIPYGQDHQQERNSGNSTYNIRKGERRASLGGGYHTLASKSTDTAASTEKGHQELPENGPFIGYKTAYDFLSQQKGPKTNPHNEARREGNELNRFMGEGMCEIFNKHYVPTRIGGKCE